MIDGVDYHITMRYNVPQRFDDHQRIMSLTWSYIKNLLVVGSSMVDINPTVEDPINIVGYEDIYKFFFSLCDDNVPLLSWDMHGITNDRAWGSWSLNDSQNTW